MVSTFHLFGGIFGGIGTIFWIFLETKLNYQKHIQYYEIHQKNQEKNGQNFRNFCRYLHFWALKPGPNLYPLATFIM